MANTTKIFFFLVILIFAFVVYAGFKVWKEDEKTAEISCLASITTPVAKALQSGQLQLNGKSRELTKEEIDTLIKQNEIGNCGREEYIFENLHIAIGEVNKKSKTQIRVWTSGDDGISGTIDDVIYPYEENADVNF